MSKIELSAAERGQIQEILTSSDFQCMEKIRKTKFSVGDILIKKSLKDGNDDGSFNQPATTELMQNSILPQRYKVLHIDEASDTAFLKEIDIDGKLDGDMLWSKDFESLNSWRGYEYFEVDPHFTDSTIFGEEFDVSTILKNETERRRKVVDMNVKLSTHLYNMRQVNDFIKSLKIGETFYFHGATQKDFFSSDYVTFEFKKARKYTLASRAEVREWQLDGIAKKLLNGKHVYCLRSTNDSLLRSVQLIGQVVYRKEPLSLSENETI